MQFDDLNREMVIELKQAYLVQKDDECKNLSYRELAEADSLVSDDEIRAFVGNCEFNAEDFLCNSREAI